MPARHVKRKSKSTGQPRVTPSITRAHQNAADPKSTKKKSRVPRHERHNERIFLVGLAVPEHIQERVSEIQKFLTETRSVKLPKSTQFRAADHITLATIRTALPDDDVKAALFEATKTPKPEVQFIGAGLIRSPDWSNLCIKVANTPRLLDARNTVAGVLGDTKGIDLIGRGRNDFQPHVTFASLTTIGVTRDHSGLFRDDGAKVKSLLHGRLTGQFIAQSIFAAQRDEDYYDRPSVKQNAWHLDFLPN